MQTSAAEPVPADAANQSAGRLQAVTRDGRSAVAYAAAAGHRGLMELLLDAGADVDQRGDDGATPLLLAAGEGRLLVAPWHLLLQPCSSVCSLASGASAAHPLLPPPPEAPPPCRRVGALPLRGGAAAPAGRPQRRRRLRHHASAGRAGRRLPPHGRRAAGCWSPAPRTRRWERGQWPGQRIPSLLNPPKTLPSCRGPHRAALGCAPWHDASPGAAAGRGRCRRHQCRGCRWGDGPAAGGEARASGGGGAHAGARRRHRPGQQERRHSPHRRGAVWARWDGGSTAGQVRYGSSQRMALAAADNARVECTVGAGLGWARLGSST